MISLILNWLVSAIVIMIAGYIIPGVEVEGFNVAIVVALILGILNAFVRPILGLITLPITILTLGLFSFVLNAFMIWIASLVVTGFDLANFWAALLMALFVAVVYAFFSRFESTLNKAK